MNKYAISAIEATLITRNEKISPVKAWEIATSKTFGEGTPSQIKGCPKGSYLGLCEVGAIKGVPKGHYTESVKNKEYAITAYEYLKNSKDKNLTAKYLWDIVLNNEGKTHNAQMNIVIELFKNDLLEI